MQSIGRPDVPGIAVSAHDQARPIEVDGNAETLSVFVNGREVLLDTVDVRLELRSLDGTVGLTGSQLDETLRFDLTAERQRTIDRWLVVVRDGAGREVHRFDGEGSPPSHLEWDGRSSDGSMLLGGEIYQYQLSTTWLDGPAATSPRRLFGVNRTSAISLELTGEAFESGSDRLSDRAQEVMSQAAEVLREHPDERILIEGHTDDVGQPAYNLELSRRRAQAALDYLVAVQRLPVDRFVLSAFGEGQPLATNDLEEGRRLNRRVEIKGDFREVDRSSVANVPRTPARVAINGVGVELGSREDFHHSLEDTGDTDLEIQAADSLGRSSRKTIPLPRLEITAPSGEFVVPLEIGRSCAGGCGFFAPSSRPGGCRPSAQRPWRSSRRTDRRFRTRTDRLPLV